LRVAITRVVALLISLTPAPALTVDVYSSQNCISCSMENLIHCPRFRWHFPQFDKRKDADGLVKGRIPTVFQISQATGEYANPVKVAFFQIVGAHYFLRVGFVKVAARSSEYGFGIANHLLSEVNPTAS
jgi:hypothetical protein